VRHLRPLERRSESRKHDPQHRRGENPDQDCSPALFRQQARCCKPDDDRIVAREHEVDHHHLKQRREPVGGCENLQDVSHRHLPRLNAQSDITAALRWIALAWAVRSGNVIAIPESGSVAHVKENAVALSLTLTPQELQTLDAAHPVR
jgi:hypothetical protein